MKNSNDILKELYELDPSLRDKETEVLRVLQTLNSTRPNTTPDPTSKSALRAQILARAASLGSSTPKSKTWSSLSWLSLGVAIPALAVLLVVFWNDAPQAARLSMNTMESETTAPEGQLKLTPTYPYDEERDSADNVILEPTDDYDSRDLSKVHDLPLTSSDSEESPVAASTASNPPRNAIGGGGPQLQSGASSSARPTVDFTNHSCGFSVQYPSTFALRIPQGTCENFSETSRNPEVLSLVNKEKCLANMGTEPGCHIHSIIVQGNAVETNGVGVSHEPFTLAGAIGEKVTVTEGPTQNVSEVYIQVEQKPGRWYIYYTTFHKDDTAVANADLKAILDTFTFLED